MKLRPLEGRAELARNCALGVVAVATQIRPVTRPRRARIVVNNIIQKLPLWLTDGGICFNMLVTIVIGYEPLEVELYTHIQAVRGLLG